MVYNISTFFDSKVCVLFHGCSFLFLLFTFKSELFWNHSAGRGATKLSSSCANIPRDYTLHYIVQMNENKIWNGTIYN